MATTPDLTLPARAPSVAVFLNRSMELRPAALYTLVSISDAELSLLQQACEAEIASPAGTSIRLAPQSSFVGSNLRAVFDYHLQLITENVYDPFYFIVAVDTDWRRGVLLVALDDGDLECKVDKFLTLPGDAGLTVVNLQIANIEWSEAKEEGLLSPGDDDDQDDNGDDDNGDGGGDENVKDGSDDLPPVPQNPPPMGDYCAVYVVSGTDTDHILVALTPFAKSIADCNNRCVILQGTLPESTSSGIVEQAFDLHPARCKRDRYLHPDLFFLSDTTEPDEHGLLLCQLPQKRTQRVSLRTPGTPYEAFQQIYLGIARGHRAWDQPGPIFMYYSDRSDQSTVDISKRMEGLKTKSLRAPFETKICTVQDAASLFPLHCRQRRFVAQMSKEYFLVVPVDWKDGVWLVRAEWDGVVFNKTDEEMKSMDLTGKVSSIRCPVEQAYVTLSEIVNGKMSWEGTLVEGIKPAAELVLSKPPQKDVAKMPLWKTKKGLEIRAASAVIGQRTWWQDPKTHNMVEDYFVEQIE